MSLSEVCKNFACENKSSKDQCLDIFSFCTNILQVVPTPVQRFILKCFYGMSLDKKTKDIIVSDHFNEKTLYHLTEYDYWKFLREQERISLQDPEKLSSLNYWTLCLPIGRRGGKTFLSAVITSYETYRLLSIHNPQEFFGIDEASEIQFTTVATARPQAALLYGMARNFIQRGSVFSKHRVNDTQHYILLESSYDIERYGKGQRPSIKITFNSCISRTLRGPGNMIGIMDECCHYITESDSASSDRQVYNALDPSIASFNKDRRMYGKMIMISSPLNRAGIMYEKYKEALLNGDENGILMIQAPSWEVNPKNVPSAYLRTKYREDKENYEREFGAQFSDKISGWLEDTHLRKAIIPELQPRTVGLPGVPTFMGIDLGLTTNGTAICITAVNANHEIELLFADAWYPTTAVVDPIYNGYVKNMEILAFEKIAEWIDELVHKFNVMDGIFDQWTGEPLKQLLAKKRVTCLRMLSFSRDLKSKVYQNFKLMLLDKKIRLFNSTKAKNTEDEIPRDSPLITELLRLQRKNYAGNLTVVNKPDVPGYQDDLSDALVRSIYAATENLDQASKIVSSLNRRFLRPPDYGHLQRQYNLKKAANLQRPSLKRSRGGWRG